MSHEIQETDEEFDARYVAFFSRSDIDGWELRKVNMKYGNIDDSALVLGSKLPMLCIKISL
jgi:hypothetical protein